MKRLLQILAALLVVITTAAAQDKFEVNGVTYETRTYTGQGTRVIVTGCSATGDVIIPSHVDNPNTEAVENYEVYSISSFKNNGSVNTGVTSVTIPTTVTSIGNQVFQGCTGLKTFNIPEGSQLNSIGSSTFKDCTSLSSISSFPAALTSIRTYCFMGCSSLTSVILTNTQLSVLDTQIFDGCSSMTECKLPETLITLNGSFKDCSSLTSIVLPSNLQTINGSFSGCTQLASINIPASVKTLGQSSFQNCSALTSIDMSQTSITSVPRECFSGATSLATIKLPSTVSSFGQSAFQNTGITKVEVSDDGIDGGVNIPSIVNQINESNIFRNCLNLVEADLNGNPNLVLGIGCFSGCSAMKTFKFPANKVLDNYAYTLDTQRSSWLFDGCTALETVTLPEVGDMIPKALFNGLKKLKTLIYPEHKVYNTFGDYAFNGCALFDGSDLVKEGVTKIGIGAFSSTAFSGDLVLPSSLTEMGSNAFSYTQITSLDYADGFSINMIPDYAFSNCKSLTSVVVPSSVTGQGFGTNCFSSCIALTTFDMSETSVTTIGNIFANCNALTTVKLNNGLQTIASSVFNGKMSLTTINFPSTLTTIGDNAFASCTSLSKNVTRDLNIDGSGEKPVDILEIPSSVTSIGSSAFYKCPIENLLFRVEDDNQPTDGNHLSIASNAFANNNKLKIVSSEYWIPQTLADNGFDENQYKNAKLYVKTNKTAYEAAPGWKNFSGITVGIEGVGVDAEDGVYTVYNLQGVRVMQTTDASLPGLAKGIYIVNGKKVVK